MHIKECVKLKLLNWYSANLTYNLTNYLHKNPFVRPVMGMSVHEGLGGAVNILTGKHCYGKNLKQQKETRSVHSKLLKIIWQSSLITQQIWYVKTGLSQSHHYHYCCHNDNHDNNDTRMMVLTIIVIMITTKTILISAITITTTKIVTTTKMTIITTIKIMITTIINMMITERKWKKMILTTMMKRTTMIEKTTILIRI